MAQLKSFYDLMNELSMKTDKNLKNLKIPVKGPKGTSKRMRMKVSTYDAPGAGDIKKAVNSSTHSADKKPEKYVGPDGLTYPAKINTNIGKIEIFEANSVQGKGVQHKINNRDNQTKQMLSARYEDLMSE